MKIWIILINAVLSVEFLVFTFCALDEQETDIIPIPICRTGKNTALGLPKQNHTEIFHGAKHFYSVSTLHTWYCAEV